MIYEVWTTFVIYNGVVESSIKLRQEGGCFIDVVSGKRYTVYGASMIETELKALLTFGKINSYKKSNLNKYKIGRKGVLVPISYKSYVNNEDSN